MMRGGTLLIWDHKVKFQGQHWPPARGCHALRCLVCVAPLMAVDTCIQPRAVEDHNIELTKVWKLNSKVWKLLMSSSCHDEQAIFFFQRSKLSSRLERCEHSKFKNLNFVIQVSRSIFFHLSNFRSELWKLAKHIGQKAMVIIYIRITCI